MAGVKLPAGTVTSCLHHSVARLLIAGDVICVRRNWLMVLKTNLKAFRDFLWSKLKGNNYMIYIVLLIPHLHTSLKC